MLLAAEKIFGEAGLKQRTLCNCNLIIAVIVWLYTLTSLFVFTFVIVCSNWESEASPTLGCSIKILCDIYIYIYIAYYTSKSEIWLVIS